MDIKPTYLWIAGITFYMLALVSAKIWPPRQSYADWEKNYIYDIMEASSGIKIDSADRKRSK